MNPYPDHNEDGFQSNIKRLSDASVDGKQILKKDIHSHKTNKKHNYLIDHVCDVLKSLNNSLQSVWEDLKKYLNLNLVLKKETVSLSYQIC